jgi:dipeptidyl-peptidase 4
MRNATRSSAFVLAGALLGVLAVASVGAQDRLHSMPGYDQFEKMQPLERGAVVSGAINATWSDDGRTFSYAYDGKLHTYDAAAKTDTITGDAPATGRGFGRGFGRGGGRGAAGRGGRGGRGAATLPDGRPNPCPAETIQRGRQATCEPSPDGTMKAYYRDRNMFLSKADGSGEVALTTDGSDAARIKYGVASWVYGEELSQRTAFWWSPDSTRVAFYRFDESQVKDFYLQMHQTDVQDTLDVEAYPKPGAPNPVADVFVYDVASKKTVKLDVRNGQPVSNDVVGYYVWDIAWLPDSSAVLLDRANRRQQVVEFTSCSPTSGACRVIVHEAWPTGWLNTDTGVSPSFGPTWLADHTRFIWQSERTGWSNFYLYDLSGRLIAPLTTNAFEAAGIVKVDETAGALYYMARDGDNYLKLQLHRVGLDGKGDVRLTDPHFTHTVSLSPDDTYIVDVYQTHDQPPATQLLDASGGVVAQIARSDMTEYEKLGLKKAEQFTYLAADGKTPLFGQISFPSNFDPSKKYPTLVTVYGGPVLVSNVPTENFAGPNPTCEYGFLVVQVSYRGVPGLGKRAADALYLKLGQTEIDDMAAGIRALWSRPYFDKDRVGIYGTSYGGYTSVMAILRYPDVFGAASASSPPTDWHNYDTIYTERYMWIPQENQAGYEAGSAMTYAKDLKGRLLLYYGSSDNNVHPSNSMQLIQALQRAGKSFEVQVGPDMGHSGVNNQRMMEFFIENLVMHPDRLRVAQ